MSQQVHTVHKISDLPKGIVNKQLSDYGLVELVNNQPPTLSFTHLDQKGKELSHKTRFVKKDKYWEEDVTSYEIHPGSGTLAEMAGGEDILKGMLMLTAPSNKNSGNMFRCEKNLGLSLRAIYKHITGN